MSLPLRTVAAMAARRALTIGAMTLASAAAGGLHAQQRDSTRRPVPPSPADTARLRAERDSIALMRELQGALATTAAPEQRGATGGAAGPTNARLLPDISAVGDFVGDFSPKSSTQADGTRFSIREVELAVQAVVDPYLRGDFFLGISDAEGISIEQAYLTSTNLPGVEVRIGRFLMPFGKQNTTHRHDLHAIEYPYVIQKFLSDDGLKGTGVLVSRVFAPFGFYQEVQATIIDRASAPAEGLVASEPANRSLRNIGYAARLRNYADISQSTNFELSFSALTGQREQPISNADGVQRADGTNVNAALARQSTLGIDLTYRWRPLQQGLYRSFLLQAEAMRQLNQRDPALPPDLLAASALYQGPTRNLSGGYVFARWQLTQRVFAGGRYDNVQDPDADGRDFTAASAYLELFPSEFSKFVAGYEHRAVASGIGEQRVLVQASFALGPHRPHPF